MTTLISIVLSLRKGPLFSLRNTQTGQWLAALSA